MPISFQTLEVSKTIEQKLQPTVKICPLSLYCQRMKETVLFSALSEFWLEQKTFAANRSALIGHLTTQQGTQGLKPQ